MPGPVNPGRRRERLTSINDPKALRTYQNKRKSTPPAPAAPKVQAPPQKCCDNPNISTDDTGKVCYSCGQVLDDSDIVAEVTFAENAAGAAIVQGGFIGENQRHANTMGANVRGISGMESRQQTEGKGLTEIRALCTALNLSDMVINQAFSWYKLALNYNFVQGRRIRYVAAVAIHLASRYQPHNTLMLIDLSERVQTSVYALGDTYKKFLQTLHQTDPAQVAGSRTLPEMEPLMLKFCRKLEFDDASHRVAEDACKIMKRMNRDWMVQGRNPAGLCGACIILAARMNNFRRSIREVVYVVKVADTTISQRLYEYKRTPSSALTVDQFRKVGQRYKSMKQPPAVWKRVEKEKRAEERERKRIAGELETSGIEEEDEEEQGNDSTQAGPSKPTKRQQQVMKKQKLNNGKANTMPPPAGPSNAASQNAGEEEEQAIPDVDALEGGNTDAGLDALGVAGDAGADEEQIIVPKKRGRPPKKREPIIISDEDLEIEAELEEEIGRAIKDWDAVFREFEENDNHEVLVRAGLRARQLVQQHMPNRNVSENPDIDDDEFEDDPDVANVLLNPEEIAFKERVWISENEDWLRDQQAKMLAKALEEAQGKPKKPKQKRKHHQMGDGSVLEGQPAASAAEAAQKMINKRAKHFSSHINYDRLKELFPDSGSPATSATTPEDTAQGASPVALVEKPPLEKPPIIEVHDADAEGGEGDAEGEDEEEYAEEEEDLENEHMYQDDYDEGFNEDENYDF